jgi:multidrug transporter EmrE-like cation transporter
MKTEPEVLTYDTAVDYAPATPQLFSKWWVAFAGSAVFVVAGHLLIKAGLNALAGGAPHAAIIAKVVHAFTQPLVVLGLCIYLMGTVCWMRAVALTEISFLYPLSSVNYVLVAGLSTLLFHEVISIERAAGVFFVIAGLFLMTSQGRRKP